MIGTIIRFLTGGILSRVLDTIDAKVKSDVDKEALKASVIKTHYETRAGFLEAGGFVLMLLFAVPLAFWFAAVCVYSVFWCELCAYPADGWSIAALPPPLDEWAGIIVVSIFGVVGLQRFSRRR